MTTLSILFSALFTGATSLALGKLLCRKLGFDLRRGEESALSFAIGSACLSTLVFLLAIAGLAYRSVFLAVGVIAIAMAWRLLPDRGEKMPPLPLLYRLLVIASSLVLGAVYLTNAVAPEMSPDGSGYHLALVDRYLREHRLVPVTDNMYASLSQGAEMLFLFAYAFGKHSGAASAHTIFLFALPFAMICYGRRFGVPRAAAAGAMFVFLSPVAGKDGSSAYNDVALAYTLFGCFYLLQIWLGHRSTRYLAAAGILAGFAFAIKYTGITAVMYAVALVAWKSRSWKAVLITGSCAAILMAPWMIKNTVVTGNPASPFFNRWFPNPYVHDGFEDEYRAYHRRYGLERMTQWPLEVTVRGEKLAGAVGPLYLLAPIALFALRWSMGRHLLLAAGFFALTYPSNIGARFLIPVLPFLSIAMALVLERLRVLPALMAAHAVLAWPPVIRQYAPMSWHIDKVPHKAALRIETEHGYLSRRLEGYAGAHLIETHAPPNAVVFSFAPLPESYTTRHVRVGYQSAANSVIRDILLVPVVDDFQPRHHLLFRFAPRRMQKFRIVQTAHGSDIWSITEVRAFRAQDRLGRNGWKVAARPNPWEVRLAFDDDPVTRWRSWAFQQPEMYLEVDVGSPQEIDLVRLDSPTDQWQTKVRLDVQAPTGEWQTIAAEPERQEAPLPPDLRRRATRAARVRGVDHILIFDTDHAADDFLKRQADWGLTLLGRELNARLYRVD